MKANSTPVLVTAVGGYGGQIMKALRLAGEGRYLLIGTDAAAHHPLSSLLDHGHQLPPADAPNYLDALFALCERYQVRAVFPGSEAELVRMSDARDLFAERGLMLPVASKDLIDVCLDKERTNERLRELGYAPPRYLKVTDRDSLDEIDWFPVVVKPSLGGGGSADCYIAQDRAELLALCDYLGLEKLVGTFIVQEYVGTPEAEYTIGVLHDLDGEYINVIGIRRVLTGQLSVRSSVPNRSGRSELGPRLVVSSGVSQGYAARFPGVTTTCCAIAQALGARGAINIQCRLVDGVVKVFEINPRFSGTTSIRAMMGYNEPDVLLRRHLGAEEIPRDFRYEAGLVLRGLTEYRIA